MRLRRQHPSSGAGAATNVGEHERTRHRAATLGVRSIPLVLQPARISASCSAANSWNSVAPRAPLTNRVPRPSLPPSDATVAAAAAAVTPWWTQTLLGLPGRKTHEAHSPCRCCCPCRPCRRCCCCRCRSPRAPSSPPAPRVKLSTKPGGASSREVSTPTKAVALQLASAMSMRPGFGAPPVTRLSSTAESVRVRRGRASRAGDISWARASLPWRRSRRSCRFSSSSASRVALYAGPCKARLEGRCNLVAGTAPSHLPSSSTTWAAFSSLRPSPAVCSACATATTVPSCRTLRTAASSRRSDAASRPAAAQ